MTTTLAAEAASVLDCPITEPAWVKPPDDPAVAGSPEHGRYFINQDRSIWASAWWVDHTEYRRAGEDGVKVGWFRPAGADLAITGQRLDAQAPPLYAHVPCCYPTRFQASGLVFPTEGCWELTARAAGSELTFVVEIDPPAAGQTPADQTSAPMAPIPSPTPDEVSQIKAASKPQFLSPLLSPDREWQAQTVVYDCVEVHPGEVLAYEELVLTNLDSDTVVIVAAQRRNCGGLGAAGLEALFWSPTTRYLYYTDAREGVPDGCGFGLAPIIRWDRTMGQSEPMGGGVRSPDGSKLVTWQQRELVLRDLDHGEIGRVQPPADAFPGQLAWSPDNEALVYLQTSSYCPPIGPTYVVRLDTDTLTQSILLESEEVVFHRVAWDLPDQLRLTGMDGQEWTYDLDTQTLLHAQTGEN